MDIVSTMLIPRLAIILFIPFQLALVVWYLIYWDLFPKYSLRRLIPCVVFILSGIIIPLLQIFIYKTITGVASVDDIWVGIIVLIQSGAVVAVIFYLLLRRRRHARNGE
jgi:hypothetical protein